MSNSPAGLKAEAKKIIRDSKPPVISVGMLLLILILIATVLTGNIISNRAGSVLTDLQNIATPEEYMEYVQSFADKTDEEIFEMAEEITPTVQDVLVIAALFLVVTCVRLGYILFLLNTVRKTNPVFGNLLDGFALILRVLGLIVFGGIVLTAGFTLFIIPGVLLFYAYRRRRISCSTIPSCPLSAVCTRAAG